MNKQNKISRKYKDWSNIIRKHKILLATMLKSSMYNGIMVYSWQLKSYLHLGQYHNFQNPINKTEFLQLNSKVSDSPVPIAAQPRLCPSTWGEQVKATYLIYVRALSHSQRTSTDCVLSELIREMTYKLSSKRIQGSCNIPESRQPKSEDFTQGNFPSGAQECFISDHIIWWPA